MVGVLPDREVRGCLATALAVGVNRERGGLYSSNDLVSCNVYAQPLSL